MKLEHAAQTEAGYTIQAMLRAHDIQIIRGVFKVIHEKLFREAINPYLMNYSSLAWFVLPLLLAINQTHAEPYIASLPTIVIKEGVSVENALLALYRFNPVNMQGLTYLVITQEQGYNCRGRIGELCLGSFEVRGTETTITIFDSEKQLTADSGVLFSNILLHELGHLIAWQRGAKGNLYGMLDEKEADDFVQTIVYCEEFAPLVTDVGFCTKFAKIVS